MQNMSMAHRRILFSFVIMAIGAIFASLFGIHLGMWSIAGAAFPFLGEVDAGAGGAGGGAGNAGDGGSGGKPDGGTPAGNDSTKAFQEVLSPITNTLAAIAETLKKQGEQILELSKGKGQTPAPVVDSKPQATPDPKGSPTPSAEVLAVQKQYIELKESLDKERRENFMTKVRDKLVGLGLRDKVARAFAATFDPTSSKSVDDQVGAFFEANRDEFPRMPSQRPGPVLNMGDVADMSKMGPEFKQTLAIMGRLIPGANKLLNDKTDVNPLTAFTGLPKSSQDLILEHSSDGILRGRG